MKQKYTTLSRKQEDNRKSEITFKSFAKTSTLITLESDLQKPIIYMED